ncbi:MAG: DUF5719 family protein [Acidimicrobiales bacterium]
MTRARVPFIVVVLGLLVVALVAERDRDRDPAPSPPDDFGVSRVEPMVASADVLGSTWYCPAGSAGEEGPADHTVIIANPTDRDRRARLTAFPGQDDPVGAEVEVEANSLERVQVSELVTAPAVAVMVELDGGEMAVSHELVGPTGADSGPCASTSSDTWHFAWGDTSADARSLFALFNPYPGDAVVDFQFLTVDGPREPQALTGVVVPGRSVVVVDAGAEVARRDQVSATATARSGRVIVERLQTFDDTEERLEGEDPRRAVTTDLGVPEPMPLWVYPSVRLVEGLTERVVVYNPGDATAEVDVEVLLSDPELGGVEPFELTIAPNRYEVVDLTDQPRLVDRFVDGAITATVVVRSLNDVPVVAERVTTVASSAEGPGITASSGSALVGRRLLLIDPRTRGTDAAALTLINLDPDRLVSGSVSIRSRGTERPLDGFEDFEIGPSGRETIDDLVDRVSGAGTSMLVIESSHPLAAGIASRRSDPSDRSAQVAIPFADDAELPQGMNIGG